MPYDDDFDDDDQDQQQPTPRDLRQQLKKLKAERAEQDKALAEYKERAEKAERAAKSTSLSNLLSDVGVDPRFAKYAETDKIDPSKEAIEAWLKDNPHIPVKSKKQDEKPAEEAPQKIVFQGVEVEEESEPDPFDNNSSLDPNMLALLEAEGSLGSQGSSPSSRSPLQELSAMDLSKFTDFDEMVGALNAKLRAR